MTDVRKTYFALFLIECRNLEGPSIVQMPKVNPHLFGALSHPVSTYVFHIAVYF